MDLLWNEVVEGEGHSSLAEFTRISTGILHHSQFSNLPERRSKEEPRAEGRNRPQARGL